MAGEDVVSDPQSEEYGLSRTVDAEHERVPDGQFLQLVMGYSATEAGIRMLRLDGAMPLFVAPPLARPPPASVAVRSWYSGSVSTRSSSH